MKQLIKVGRVGICLIKNACIVMCMLINNAGASGIIPVSQDDITQNDSDFLQTVQHVFQHEVCPLLEIIAGVLIIYIAISGLWKGYAQYQRERDIGVLKTSVVASAIITTVGGGLIYLLEIIRNYTFS